MLKGEAKKKYQREYMRRKRGLTKGSNKEGSNNNVVNGEVGASTYSMPCITNLPPVEICIKCGWSGLASDIGKAIISGVEYLCCPGCGRVLGK